MHCYYKPDASQLTQGAIYVLGVLLKSGTMADTSIWTCEHAIIPWKLNWRRIRHHEYEQTIVNIVKLAGLKYNRKILNIVNFVLFIVGKLIMLEHNITTVLNNHNLK